LSVFDKTKRKWIKEMSRKSAVKPTTLTLKIVKKTPRWFPDNVRPNSLAPEIKPLHAHLGGQILEIDVFGDGRFAKCRFQNAQSA
jgi:hypothetical protein